MRFLLPLAAFALLLPVARPADNWPAYRGPNGDGTSDAKGLPTEWSEEKNVRWKTPIHGKGWSSPVVWGDQIWMTTAEEVRGTAKVSPKDSGGGMGLKVEKVTFYAVCVDRKTGKIVHDIKLAEETDPLFCHDFNSYASPTPTIEAGRVYAHFGSHGTWCIDTATGKPLWERRDLKCNHYRGPGSSPILYENLLVMIYDGSDFQYVAALDKATGATAWKKDRNIKYVNPDNGDYKKAYATPQVVVVAGKPQLICPSGECTIAYEPMTGEELWRFHHLKKSTMNVGARTVAGHGFIYLLSGYPAQLMALKQGVSGMVPKDAVAWETAKDVPSRPSLLLLGDLLFMINDDGFLTCLDAKTGAVYRSDRQNGNYSASPVYADGHIYLANQTGKTIVVKASKSLEPVATNELKDGCMASPAIAGDALILRTKTHLYCIGNK